MPIIGFGRLPSTTGYLGHASISMYTVRPYVMRRGFHTTLVAVIMRVCDPLALQTASRGLQRFTERIGCVDNAIPALECYSTHVGGYALSACITDMA